MHDDDKTTTTEVGNEEEAKVDSTSALCPECNYNHGNFTDEPPMKTHAEMREIAMAMYNGQAFSQLSFRSADEAKALMPLVFMPLMLGALQHVNPHKVGMVYEYVSEATIAIDGYPVFASARMIHVDQMPLFFRYFNELKVWASEDENETVQ